MPREPKEVVLRQTYGTRRQVWNGSALKTTGGLVRTDLFKNKQGKIVSKSASEHSAKLYKKNGLVAFKKKPESGANIRRRR